ncbi:MAG: hypothetical protein WCJ46_02575 [bacterium]
MKNKIGIISGLVILIAVLFFAKVSCMRTEKQQVKDLKKTEEKIKKVFQVPTAEQKSRIYKFMASKEEYLKASKKYNVFIIKTDAKGDCVWATTYPEVGYEWGEFVMQNENGGYAVLGKGYSDNKDLNFVIINVSANGKTNTATAFNATDYKHETQLAKLTDGGQVLINMTYAGTGSGRLTMNRKDKWGNKKWARSYGLDFYDWGETSVYSPDKTTAVIGYMDYYNPSDGDVFLIKKTKRGNTQWVKTFGGENYDWAYSLMNSGEGGYIISGITYSFGNGNDDAYIVKTDSKGDCVWAKTYGGAGFDEAYCAIPVRGGFVFAGTTTSKGAGGYDAWLVKVNQYGNVIWEKTYGGIGDDAVYYVDQTSDGGYIITGASNSF